jgi:Predicted transcriptional regulators
MNQRKIGMFLKELRKEKGLTQEQFAEVVNVSNRTVSRWENGNNMPDLDILIEISDYYEVDLREILDGERKNKNMKNEVEETVLKAVDYTNTELERNNKRVRLCNAIAMLLILIYLLVEETSLYDNLYIRNGIYMARGMAVGMLLTGLVISSKYGLKIRAFKQRMLRRQR